MPAADDSHPRPYRGAHRGEGGADEVSGEDDITGSIDASDDLYGGSGDDFIDAVDGREDDCGRLQSPTAGVLDIDTALVDSMDIAIECENTVVSNPAP